MSALMFSGALEIGLIYSLVTLGIYITFRTINFPDLTVDGSFSLGAAVSAILIIHHVDPILATFLAIFAGAIAGCITGYLYVRFKISEILAGILTMTALYSINLHIMGRPNIALLNATTLFSHSIPILILLGGIVFMVLAILYYFLKTEFGLSLRAVGKNPQFCVAYGINPNSRILLALMIGNALVAFAGSLFAQSQEFADVSVGTGTIIAGLAAIMIGEVFKYKKSILFTLFSCVLGTLIYRLIITVALNNETLGLRASDVNLISTTLVVFIFILSKVDYKALLFKKERDIVNCKIEAQERTV